MKTKEERTAYDKKYYAENKEKRAAYQRKYYAENPEKRAAYGKKYYDANRDKQAAINKKWNANNPEKKAGYTKKARENLSDCYVSNSFSKLKNSPYTAKELRQFPDIIETLRLIMKIKRLCIIKNKENENS